MSLFRSTANKITMAHRKRRAARRELFCLTNQVIGELRTLRGPFPLPASEGGRLTVLTCLMQAMNKEKGRTARVLKKQLRQAAREVHGVDLLGEVRRKRLGRWNAYKLRFLRKLGR